MTEATEAPMFVTEEIGNPSTHETCDRCGAMALVRVILLSGLPLTFCGHHGRQFGYEQPVPDSKLQGSEN